MNKRLPIEKQSSGPMGKVKPMRDGTRKKQEANALAGVIETLYSEHGHFLSLLDTLEQG